MIACCKLQLVGRSFAGSSSFYGRSADGIALAVTVYRFGRIEGASEMLDVIIVFVTVLFFSMSWLYVIACDRLK
jgi:hypothetical protein